MGVFEDQVGEQMFQAFEVHAGPLSAEYLCASSVAAQLVVYYNKTYADILL